MDNQKASPKQALLERLQQSTNILVTVSTNPSVDQLAACLGLTLWLNKIGKHATAVFSGEVPSTLEFLRPEDTIEKTTDSLRDFIIALDKSKADKLRYKVEDTVVKIFITPYRTNLTPDDLEYSQGDFNVDMVIALGVAAQQDLDAAITAHGRILHDAAVATIMVAGSSELGSINWQDSAASSLSELVVDLGNNAGREHLDGQIATALLTGIVAETARFSNDKTSPQTMSVSAELMSAGANQQLVASQLDAPEPEAEPAEPENPASNDETSATPPAEEPPAAPKNNDGTIEIDHEHDAEAEADDAQPAQPPTEEQQNFDNLPNDDQLSADNPEPEATNEAETPQIADVKANGDEQAVGAPSEALPVVDNQPGSQPSKMIFDPPSMGGTLTANSRPDDIMREPTSDPMSSSGANQPLLNRDSNDSLPPLPPSQPPADDPAELQPAPPSWMPNQSWLDQPPAPNAPENNEASQAEAAQPQTMSLPDPVDDQSAEAPSTTAPLPSVDPNETLTEIEAAVHSTHLQQSPPEEQPDLGSARDEVMRAINSVPDNNPQPVQALNAQPIDLGLPAEQPSASPADELPLPSELPPLPLAPAASTAFDPAQFETLNDSSLTNIAPSSVPQMQPALDPELTGPVAQPFTMPLPTAVTPPPANPVPPTSSVSDPTAPPPVPPPLMPPGFPPAQ